MRERGVAGRLAGHYRLVDASSSGVDTVGGTMNEKEKK